MWIESEDDDRAMREGRDPAAGDRSRRKAVAALSAVAAANMAVISSRQLGLVRHLPDPPIPGFDADRVTGARAAFIFGVPDAPLACASLAGNIPLAMWGGPDRAMVRPWLPLAAASKALAEAAIAGWYFARMPTRLHAWCAYCIVGAGLDLAIAGLTLPEARRALPNARPAVTGAIAAAALLAVGIWAVGHGRGAPRAA